MRSGCPISRARGSCIKRSSIPDRIGIQKRWFLRRGENRSTRRKTSRSREENQQQTQPTYDVESRNRTRAALVEGECSHHCAIPAPLNNGSGSGNPRSWRCCRGCAMLKKIMLLLQTQLRLSLVSQLVPGPRSYFLPRLSRLIVPVIVIYVLFLRGT